MIGEIFATQTTSDNEIVLDVTVRGPSMIGQICLDWILKQRIFGKCTYVFKYKYAQAHKSKMRCEFKTRKTHSGNRNSIMISIHTNGF